MRRTKAPSSARRIAGTTLLTLVSLASAQGLIGAPLEPPEVVCADKGELRTQCIADVTEERVKAAAFKAESAAAARVAEAEETRRLAARETCVKAGWKLGAVRLGMTRRQVEDCGWGIADDARRSTTAARVVEVWFYGRRQSLTFENDRLTAIRE